MGRRFEREGSLVENFVGAVSTEGGSTGNGGL
jgi:hypothetical protein